MSAIWHADYLDRNLRKLRGDSIDLTLECRTGPNTAQSDPGMPVKLEEGNPETTFRESMKMLGQSMSINSKRDRKPGGGSLPVYSTTHSMLQLLSCIDSWQMHTCKHSSPFVVPTIAAICISASSQILESLMTWLQLFQDSGTLCGKMPSYEELTRLRSSLGQYTEASRTAQLESLLNENSAPAEILSKARNAVSNAIDHVHKVHSTASEGCNNVSNENGHKVSHISDRTRLATRNHLSSEPWKTIHFSISLKCAKKKEHLFVCDLSDLRKT